jgi:hypothetical protein
VDQRRVRMDAFERSGKSASGFAAQHGVKIHHLRQLGPKTEGGPARSQAVSGSASGEAAAACRGVLRGSLSPAGGGGTALEVCLPGGGRLAIGGMTQMPLAAALIRELSRSC